MINIITCQGRNYIHFDLKELYIFFHTYPRFNFLLLFCISFTFDNFSEKFNRIYSDKQIYSIIIIVIFVRTPAVGFVYFVMKRLWSYSYIQS